MNEEADDLTRPRGQHRVFLSYAAGVGKTYAMLTEARQRRGRGEDVVIGYLEPHIRPRTKALAKGLEIVPPRLIGYHGSEFTELDTSAVIARRPQWVLVDELAHTCVPGASHAKRWEAVEEILRSGVGVLSTLNVQHIQGINDYVFQYTGVRVAETVPDEVLGAAEVIVVDMDPDDLIKRVRRGAVLPQDEVGQALTHFFRKPALTALRAQAVAVGRRSSPRSSDDPE